MQDELRKLAEVIRQQAAEYGAMARSWGTVAWVYWALHGSYGLCWLLKDRAFPDRAWERRVTWASAVFVSVFPLAAYWSFPFLVVTRGLGTCTSDPGNALLAGAIALHTLGVVLMMTADAQKNFTLPLRRGLLTTGLYARIRHPNYLGEMMLYGAYALLGRRGARAVARLASWGLLAAGLFLSWSWLVWWALTRFAVGLGHPPTVVQEPRLEAAPEQGRA